MTDHNILEFWKLIDKIQVRLLDFDTTSNDVNN